MGGFVFFFPGLAASADSSRTSAARSAFSSVALDDFRDFFGGGTTTSLSSTDDVVAFCLLLFFRVIPNDSPAARTADSESWGPTCAL